MIINYLDSTGLRRIEREEEMTGIGVVSFIVKQYLLHINYGHYYYNKQKNSNTIIVRI